jgi:hypothetical protein
MASHLGLSAFVGYGRTVMTQSQRNDASPRELANSEKHRAKNRDTAVALQIRVSELEMVLRECQKYATLPPTDLGYALKARVDALIGCSTSVVLWVTRGWPSRKFCQWRTSKEYDALAGELISCKEQLAEYKMVWMRNSELEAALRELTSNAEPKWLRNVFCGAYLSC